MTGMPTLPGLPLMPGLAGPTLSKGVGVPSWLPTGASWGHRWAVSDQHYIQDRRVSSTAALLAGGLATYSSDGEILYEGDASLTAFAADAVPFETSRGLCHPPARTNKNRNSEAVGAVVGAPGTAPTHWGISVSDGLSREIVGTGTEGGVPYVDFRVLGTTTTSRSRTGLCTFDGRVDIAALTGQIWAGSLFCTLVGGSMANVTLYNEVREMTSTNSTVRYAQAAFAPVAGDLADNKISDLFTLTGGATVAKAQHTLGMAYASGVAIDFTLRVGLPNLQFGDFDSPPISSSGTEQSRTAPELRLFEEPGDWHVVAVTNTDSGLVVPQMTLNQTIDETGWLLPTDIDPVYVSYLYGFPASDVYRAEDLLASFEMSEGHTISAATKTLVSSAITLSTTAIGRVPDGGGDAPTIALTSGFTHDSTKYFPGGWNGFKYWKALTPFFGATGTDPQYENPTIFCGNDPSVFAEPVGLTNPIDLPPPFPSAEYNSDTHLELGPDGYLYCFWRPFASNVQIKYRRSLDGVNWEAEQLLYSTDALASVDYDNLLLSPAYIYDGDWHEFICIRSSATGLALSAQKNQTQTFVLHRSAAQLDGLGEFSADQVVTFTSRPWGAGNDPWHVHVTKIGNLWLMALNVGGVGGTSGSALYLCYSTDGATFDVFPTSLFGGTTYRSSILPVAVRGNTIECYLYQCETTAGDVNVYSLDLTIT